MGGGDEVGVGVGDVDHLLFGRLAPEDEDDGVGSGDQLGDDGVCKALPPFSVVGLGLASADGEGGVEEEDPLFGPSKEGAAIGGGDPKIIVELFVDVAQGGGEGNPIGDAEAEPFGLAGPVVGVLSHDDHFDRLEGGLAKGVEDEGGWREDELTCGQLLAEEVGELGHVGLVQLIGEEDIPGGAKIKGEGF